MNKFAALSPAIQALEQVPTSESQRQIFERHIGDTAYQVFAAKYPDLVESIVTYKLLDSNPDAGTGFGVFILDLDGESLYVPTVFADSELAPIEIMYVKSKDMFAPLTPEWIAATQRGADQALGEAQKLPETVATDVDIRNLMVPPMTGRYSYASDEAAASEPLGRRLMKLAEQGFDPKVWEMFVSQYSQMNGTTPGMALDSGQTNLDELGKMYKSHAKTWAAQPAQPAGQPQGQAQPPAQGGQPQQPGMQQPPAQQAPAQPQMTRPAMQAQFGAPKMASLGTGLDNLLESAGYGAAVGGATGGLTALYDGEVRDTGNRILQGAAGGALGGTIGGVVGRGLNAKHPQLTQGMADELGHLAGGALGGLSASDPERMGLAPTPTGYDQSMYRYASHEEGILAMAKHAQASPPATKPRLLDFLRQAPNNVKTAFANTLKKRPHLLKFAAEAYGVEALMKSFEKAPEVPKVAAAKEMAVSVKTKGSDARSFRGTALRGYFYEDKKPARNVAVQRQERTEALDIRESGAYTLFKADGSKAKAMVYVDPIDLLGEYQPPVPNQDGMVRTQKRLAVLEGGKYLCENAIFGEKIVSDAEPVLKLQDKPTQGLGMFVCVDANGGMRATLPLRLTKVKTLENGVIEALGTSTNGDREKRVQVAGGRIIRPAGGDFVIVPASWKWRSLSSENTKNSFLLSAGELFESALTGITTKIRVRDVEPEKKAEALEYIANTYSISGADAEAILKIAELERHCDVLIIPKDKLVERSKIASAVEQAFGEILGDLGAEMENVQGQMQVLQRVQQRAQELAQTAGQPPIGMQQTDPAMQATPPAPPAPPAAEAPAPGGAAAPAQAAPDQQDPAATGAEQASSTEQAPPAQAAAGAPPAATADPMAEQAPAVDPATGQPLDPAAAAQMPPEQPPLPLMTTEEPSSMEIEQQINPEFLEQAAVLQDRGVFDTGALAELDRAMGRAGVPTPAPVTNNTQSLESTVDDLGRTLLSIQLKSIDLQEQLSGDTYHELEEQVRNTFQGLGKLLLEMNQHGAALQHASDTQAA
jgi:hypothetical protein